MIALAELQTYLTTLLSVNMFDDYAPNGVQVEGKPKVARLITGVTACQALLDAAVAHQADAVLVHHGYFWRGESPCLVGMKKHRVTTLLQHDVSLLAYHLPLDAHLEYGNNVQLAQQLGINDVVPLADQGDARLVFVGELTKPQSADEFSAHIAAKLQREPLHLAGNEQAIKRVAWCTGAAQDFIEMAAAAGADAFISGEVSERTTHITRELGIHYYAAGHHATERYGVQALGEHLAQQFQLDHQFIDIDNPV